MTIWADADSLPAKIRHLVAKRVSLKLIESPAMELKAVFAANRAIKTESMNGSENVIVSPPDAVDDFILKNLRNGDLVITRDIPLAEKALMQGAFSINDRGDIWTPDNIRERRSLRDFMEKARIDGYIQPIKTKSYGPEQEKKFANAFDRVFSKLTR